MINAATYAGARAPATAASGRLHVKMRKSFFARFVEALKETRKKEACLLIERHAHLLLHDKS